MTINKATRILNGYRVVYLPDHPRAMASKNWSGYVYEHIVVAEKFLGRCIRASEVVHHLDFDRANNRHENLLVLERGQHMKLHVWLASGAPGWQQSGEHRVNSGKPKGFCLKCNHPLQDKQKKYCSVACRPPQSVGKPVETQLMDDLKVLGSLSAVGRKYDVSHTTIRRWLGFLPTPMAILSQAEGTPSEGAETSGEVQSS